MMNLNRLIYIWRSFSLRYLLFILGWIAMLVLILSGYTTPVFGQADTVWQPVKPMNISQLAGRTTPVNAYALPVRNFLALTSTNIITNFFIYLPLVIKSSTQAVYCLPAEVNASDCLPPPTATATATSSTICSSDLIGPNACIPLPPSTSTPTPTPTPTITDTPGPTATAPTPTRTPTFTPSPTPTETPTPLTPTIPPNLTPPPDRLRPSEAAAGPSARNLAAPGRCAAA